MRRRRERGCRASVMMPIHAAAPPHARLSLERFQGPPPEARSIAWTRGDLKALTIDCVHTVGVVLASLTNGIIVNAGLTDRIVLRGLDIHGVGNGFDGIKFIAGGSLHVEDSVISGMQNGINIGAGNEIYIKNNVYKK